MSLGKLQQLEQVIFSTSLEAVQLHFLRRSIILRENVEVDH
jgi:hypothetical protein